MNAKFYVPFETAQLLRKAGYPQSDSDMYYDLSGNLTPDNGFLPIDDDVCPAAPAYCEVLDWLIGKKIYIDIDCTAKGKWYCYMWEGNSAIDATGQYFTREQAINAAIVRVLEELL